MKRRFFLLINLYSFSMFSEILKIDDLAKVKGYVSTQNPLILFDVEKTLLTYDRNTLEKFDFNFEEFDELNNKNFKLKWFFVKPIQPNTSEVISDLQDNYKVLALTLCKNLKPYYKFFQLDKLGIDLNRSYPNLPLIHLEGSKGEALFDNGFICCGKNDKGSVLYDFLCKTGISPSQIIFVDDKVKNLESVEEYMGKMGIPYTGLWLSNL